MGYIFRVDSTTRNPAAGALGQRLASKLLPVGGTLDVVKNFPWTFTKGQAALNQTPYIELKEFTIEDTAINQMLKAYNTSISGIIDVIGVITNPGGPLEQVENNLVYENLYDHKTPTGFNYKFPYFENPLNTQNNWVGRSSYEFMIQLQRTLAEVKANVDYINTFVPIGAPLTQERYMEGIEKLLRGSPNLASLEVLAKEAGMRALERSSIPAGALPGTWAGEPMPLGESLQKIKKMMVQYETFKVDFNRTKEQLEILAQTGMGNIGQDPVLDKPHIWSSSQPRVFNVTFPLYNTNPYEPDNPGETISRNWELCYLLTYQNLYNKQNLFTGKPPVFYSVNVPGIYYTKAAYVSNITVLNVGNIRNMFLPVGNSLAAFAPGGEGQPNFQAVNVPDAYVVTMTLVDFFMPSRNFLDTINNQSKRIEVTKSGP